MRRLHMVIDRAAIWTCWNIEGAYERLFSNGIVVVFCLKRRQSYFSRLIQSLLQYLWIIDLRHCVAFLYNMQQHTLYYRPK